MSEREHAVAPVAVPPSLEALVAEYDWSRDTVGESGGAVYRLHASGRPDLYLKSGSGNVADAITDELVRLRWLWRHLAVPAVQAFVWADDSAWLLMTAMPGKTAYQMLADDPDNRAAIVDALAMHLRALHAIPRACCPFDSSHAVRMAQARTRIDAGLVDTEDFGDDHEGWTAEQVWGEMIGMLPLSPDPVVTHGDYSLDNILIADGRVVGCIDVGRAGVADRYQDLAILWNCLGEFEGDWQRRMMATYGLAEPDMVKVRFHLCLDEMF